VNDLLFDLFKIDSDQPGLDAIGSDPAASNPAADSLPRHVVMHHLLRGSHFDVLILISMIDKYVLASPLASKVVGTLCRF
jgi:hypothetical protein